MPLPPTGTLSLQGHSRPGDALPSKPKQAMIVRMSAETLEALEAFPNQPPMEFAFGGNSGIYIGEEFFPMRPLKEGSPHELYLRSSSAAKPMAPLKLYANVTGKFTVERELRDKVTDKVRLHTQVAEQQRTERKVQMLDTPPAIARANGTGKKRKAPANSAFPSSSSSSLLKRAAHNDMRNASTSVPSRVASPLPPTSTPPPSTAKESSARRRMVQYVAITHRLPEDVVRALGGPDCDSSTRRMLLDLLDEIAEPNAPAKKGDKTPRSWALKSRTWLEVRPYEWKLTEPERTAMARSARLVFKSLKIPETDPAWAYVRYKNTGSPLPTNSPSTATGAATPRTSTPNTTMAARPSPATSARPEPKRGVMSLDAKEKKAKAKAEAPKIKTADIQMKDESAKMSRIAGAKSKESHNPPAARSTPLPQGAGKRLPSSVPKVQKTSDSGSGSSADTPLRKTAATPDGGRPAPRASAPSSVPHRPSAVASTQGQEKRPVTTTNMRISKKAAMEGDKERAGEREPSTGGVKRKKPIREDDEHDEELARKTSLQKKRKVDDGALPVINASTSKEPRIRDLSLPKKPTTDLSPSTRKITKAPSPVPPTRPPPAKTTSTLPPAPTTISSRPRALDKDRAPVPVAAKSNSAPKPRRRSPIYTSSEDEGEITPSQYLGPLPSFMYNPRPRPPLPPASDHAALRKRYNSSYQEFIAVFSMIIAQKSKMEAVLRGDSDADNGVELLESKELARLASEHHSLRDELEGIKSVFLAGKLPGEDSPRSD